MLDGIHLCEGLCSVAAIGIDRSGAKHVLGFRIGSSENAEVCRDLVGDLHRRGLRPVEQSRFLAVLDGSKALRDALLELYPDTVAQRCLVHKERNLRGYLSKRHWADVGRLFTRLRKSQGKEDALERVAEIEAFLEGRNGEALKSLREAGEDLVTFFALEVPSTLIPGCDDMDKLEAALANSSERPDLSLLHFSISVVFATIATIIGANWGIVGIAVAIFLNSFIHTGTFIIILHKTSTVSPSRYLTSILAPVFSAIIMTTSVIITTTQIIPGTNAYLRATFGFITGALNYAICLRATSKESFTTAKEITLRAITRYYPSTRSG